MGLPYLIMTMIWAISSGDWFIESSDRKEKINTHLLPHTAPQRMWLVIWEDWYVRWDQFVYFLFPPSPFGKRKKIKNCRWSLRSYYYYYLLRHLCLCKALAHDECPLCTVISTAYSVLNLYFTKQATLWKMQKVGTWWHFLCRSWWMKLNWRTMC